MKQLFNVYYDICKQQKQIKKITYQCSVWEDIPILYFVIYFEQAEFPLVMKVLLIDCPYVANDRVIP